MAFRDGRWLATIPGRRSAAWCHYWTGFDEARMSVAIGVGARLKIRQTVAWQGISIPGALGA